MNIETDLIALNEKSVRMEQSGGQEARTFFEALLSDQLVFRRAGGEVIGKCGTEGFLEGLKKNPFESRVPEDVAVKVQGNRALVTLIVVAKRTDDKSVHRYRNIRFFERCKDKWVVQSWYNYEIPEPGAKELMVEYQENCKSHQAIADFRGKLLSFLPLASGAGLVVLLAKKNEPVDMTHLTALGLFGCLITIGLFLHEYRGIKHCWDLIKRGKDLEQKLGFSDGQFTTDFNYYTKRFRPVLGPEGASWVIYATIFLSWVYVALGPSLPKKASPEANDSEQTALQGALATNTAQISRAPTSVTPPDK